MNKIKALLALALTLPAPALSQSPASAPSQKRVDIERIVGTEEFKTAAQRRDVPLMNQLLAGTGGVAAVPVDIFYCKPPTTPVFQNNHWYCIGGGIIKEVHPYMYLE